MSNSIDRLTGAVMEKLFIELEASARHVHLTESDARVLFGHGLTPKRDLSQPGQYLCEERVSVAGPKGTLERVAVLGPSRGESQVEISLTDARVLGVEAPIRLSGDIENTPGIRLQGERGEITLRRGLIVAKRHIHMTPRAAQLQGVKHGDVVRLQCLTARPLILEDVAVRVSDKFATYAHLDFDEANACAFRPGDLGRIVHG